MDQPIFWIQKLDHEGQSDNLHDAWIDLVQRIEKGSFLEQQLVKCLMKWYTKKNNLTQESLDGITVHHISAFCGVKSILELIVSSNINPNPSKGNGVTPIYSASYQGHIEIVKFLASKVDNPNEARNDGIAPIYIASCFGHIDIVKFLASKVDNPNEARNDGITPILIASKEGHIDIVKFLASKVDHPNQATNDGTTAFSRTFFYTNRPILPDVWLAFVDKK